MALTENEKKILGMMTDAGVLKGTRRVEVAASDSVAREVVASYKSEALIQKNKNKTAFQNSLIKVNAEIAILEGE